MFYSAELQIIQCIQQIRNPVFDAFFKFLDHFDRPEFFFALIPALWLGQGWKTGLRIFYILFLSSLANHTLKEIFISPRPFYIDSNLGLIHVGGYGFPSGAAQTVMLLSGILLTYWKNPWKWCIAFSYILFISFSRVYLGVHFPTDILGGWIVGIALWVLYVYVRPPIERQLEKLSSPYLFLLSQLIPLLLLFWQNYSATSVCAMGMGMGVGLLINHACGWCLPSSSTKKESVLRAFIGIAGTFFCYSFITNLPIPHIPLAIFFQFFVLGLWVATGGLLLCRAFLPPADSLSEVKKDA